MSVSKSARTPSRSEYTERINRVVDHVERNLDQPLSLSALAEVAHLSRFHFHRVFAAMTGETLHQFVSRLRVERAAQMLLRTPAQSVTSIAIDCGFSSSATFARTFKAAFGVTGTQWRAHGDADWCADDRKNRKHLRNDRNAESPWGCYIVSSGPTHRWRLEVTSTPHPLTADVTIQDVATRHVAYIRHVGPYGQVAEVPRLFERLHRWLGARELISAEMVNLVVAHDDPKITPDDKLRLSVCATVAPTTQGEGEVGVMSLPGGKCGVARFEIPPERIAEAWNAVMGVWLPDSGYQPDDRHCYEVVVQSPRDNPQGLIVLDIYTPVRPL
ncbi:MAG: AraC family transcriptional regulator [Nannocystales bacterium]